MSILVVRWQPRRCGYLQSYVVWCLPRWDTNVVAGTIPKDRGDLAIGHQRWQVFTFLYWAYDPAQVQRLLPSELRVHTDDGLA
jgi:uncharacterized protein YqjF (DUF2071 family)